MKQIAPLLLLFTTLITACSREADIRTPQLIEQPIVFDWGDSYTTPMKGMVVWLYSRNGGRPYRYDIADNREGVIALREGVYDIICYNNGMNATIARHERHFSTHELYTLRRDMTQSAGSEAAVASDPAWSYSMQSVELSRHIKPLRLTPKSISCHYSFEVRNVPWLNQVQQMVALLSGMADGYKVGIGECSAATTSVIVDAYSNGNNRIKGEFLCLGRRDEAEHTLEIIATMLDGTTRTLRYEVTEQVASCTNAQRVHITTYYEE